MRRSSAPGARSPPASPSACLVAGGWFATGYLGADDFNPAPVTSLTFVAPIADTVQYAMLSTGLTLNFGIAMVAASSPGAW